MLKKIIKPLRAAWQYIEKFFRYAAWHRRRGCSLCGSAKRAAFWLRNELKQQRA